MFREARERAGMTQAELADRIGVGSQQISNMEREVAPVPVKYWKKLSLTLKLPLSRIEEYSVNRFRRRLKQQMKGNA